MAMADPSIRDLLFADLPVDLWPPRDALLSSAALAPFASAREHLAAGREAEAIACWRDVLADEKLEPRTQLQAWHFLRQHGQSPPPEVAKDVLGTVVEVGMADGLDLLAAYRDHTARYYNYSGAGVVWERPDGSLDPIIDQLLLASSRVVLRIGPWDGERPGPPPKGQVRVCFLTPSGLHFGQGAWAAISADELGGQVVAFATALMSALIEKSEAGRG